MKDPDFDAPIFADAFGWPHIADGDGHQFACRAGRICRKLYRLAASGRFRLIAY
jgi:hypothetical protein